MAVNSTQNIAENRQKYAQYFEKKEKDSLSMENFFSLLMAEMSNQDPMEPMSNTEFVSQMANFTALKAQQDALYYQNANYAQSLVGKSVTVATVKGSELYTDSGIVTSMGMSEGAFFVKVNGEDYPLANIMEVMPSVNPFAVTGSDGAYATSLIGKQVTVMSKNSDGAKVIETGAVSHIEIANNEISVVIKGLAYPLSSVVKVELPGAVSETEDDEDEEYDGEGFSEGVSVKKTDDPESPDEPEPPVNPDENDGEELKNLFD